MAAKPSTQPTSGKNEDELVALCSIPSDGSLRQQRVLGHLTSRDDEPLQEKVKVVDFSSYKSSIQSKSENRVLLYKALVHGEFETASRLLTNSTIKFDFIESQGDTALHSAVMRACHKGDTQDSYYRCIDLLMNCQGVKLNTLDFYGYTALGNALNDRNMTCVEHMLKNTSANRLYLDYYPGNSEYTVREIIMEKYPHLLPLLKEPIMESIDSSQRDIKLLAALQHDKYQTFLQNLDSTNCNTWYDEPYHSSLLEIACQMKNRKKFVELLLKKGADPNIKNRFTCFPLLHAAARSGNFEVLEVLLENHKIDASVKDSEDRTVLHWWARVSERKPGDKQMLENCFKLLKEHYSVRKMNIDFRDISHNTPLYMAVESGFRDRAKLLLSEGADFMVFEHGSKILLSASLSIVEEFLDNCLESNDKPVTSKDLKLTLKYHPLIKIVPRLAESLHHRDLLKHPVTSTFLILKWQKVKLVFFVDMFFYLMFVLFLTAYILCSESYNTLNEGDVANNTTGPFSFNDSYITSGMNDTNFTSQPNESILLFLWLSLMFLLFLLTLREIIQLVTQRRAYIESLENWLEICLIIATFVSCSGVVASDVKLHFSAVVLLLGWLELLLMLGRLPLLSVQQEMLKTVTLTFLRFMAGYAILLIAFAFSFYILFKGSLELDGTEMFANPFLSVLKTIVMFTGEFDASSLPFGTFPYTSHVIFLLFVVLVAIILLNLLNGLAVSDTHEIKKEAETLSLAARAKLISRIEGILSALPKCIKTFEQLRGEISEIYPKERNTIGYTAVRSLLSIISKETELNKEPETSGNQEKWDTFTKKLSELEKILYSKSDETQQILMQILTRLDNRECETAHLQI